ncbi:MAG: alpha-amylase family protein [Lachnospiraceae bacterium]|nr:alpha-amylase family protein [Lachnospiraceae bacterium]
MSEHKKRLLKYYDEMKWLYMELYNNDTAAFDYYVSMLEEYAKDRSDKLKAWDKKRRSGKGSEWYKDNRRLGMLAYTDCFAGDLHGVKEHLSYLKETGVNYIHLMPLLQSPEGRSDGGYAVSDFRKVDPGLGTMEDLEDLADECHESGISLCLDFVMNHTSEDHEWAKRAANGEKEYQDRYFFYDNWDIPAKMEETIPQVFPTTAPGNFTWCSKAGKVVMTTFYPYQWDLNYHNPVVFNDMTANMLFLCNRGVDIIRLDATPYIWKMPETKCRNLPQVHTLVRLMRIACEIVAPGTLLLGEIVMEPKEVVPYFGTKDQPECHLLYNVTTMASIWHTVATKDTRLLADQLTKVFALPENCVFLNYLRCHDDIGWGLDYDFLSHFGIEEAAHKRFLNDYFRDIGFDSGSRGELYNDDPRLKDARLCGTTASLCGIEEAEWERDDEKLKTGINLDVMLHAFLFTLSGIPVLYSGDEIGQLNDYSYKEDPQRADDSRYLHRGSFNWDDAAKRDDPSTRQGRIYRAIHDLYRLRCNHKAFANSADTWLIPLSEGCSAGLIGIGRYYDKEKILAFYNFSQDPQVIHTEEDESYQVLTSSEDGPVKSGDGHFVREFELLPYGFVWYRKKYR